ncbi:MAG TPA: hypothetical protein QF901_05300 [Gammaproteobacteria bacterium]|nr:hypothetical protein [Gammaproteobacteria bacterium]
MKNELGSGWSWEKFRTSARFAIPDELIETVCVFGSEERCRAQLRAFREAGADVPLLAVSPVNEERLAATRTAVATLGAPQDITLQELFIESAFPVDDATEHYLQSRAEKT